MDKEKARLIDGLANPELILPMNCENAEREQKRAARKKKLEEMANFIYELMLRILVFAVGYILAKHFLTSLQG